MLKYIPCAEIVPTVDFQLIPSYCIHLPMDSRLSYCFSRISYNPQFLLVRGEAEHMQLHSSSQTSWEIYCIGTVGLWQLGLYHYSLLQAQNKKWLQNKNRLFCICQCRCQHWSQNTSHPTVIIRNVFLGQQKHIQLFWRKGTQLFVQPGGGGLLCKVSNK